MKYKGDSKKGSTGRPTGTMFLFHKINERVLWLEHKHLLAEWQLFTCHSLAVKDVIEGILLIEESSLN